MKIALPYINWGFRIIAALIMLQTLYVKFTGAPESVYIFSTLGVEPWGRYASRIVELFASGLLFVSPLAWSGALLGMGTMSGAILSHWLILGISVPNGDGTYDGGYLFALAWVVWLSCAAVLFIHRRDIPLLGHYWS